MTVLLAATGWHFMRGGQPVGEEEIPTPAWGALVITSEPPGARLMDTRGTPLGTTPIELKGLDGGLSWEGILEMDGYLVSKVAAEVAAGETKPVPTVELKPKPQKVIVSSEPSGAAVLEGDEVLGVTPLELPEIPPGTKHVYQLELDGFEAMEVSGEVKVGESLRLNGQMKENPKPYVEPVDFTDLPPDWVSSQEELLPAFTNYLTSLKLRNISPEEVIRAHAISKGEVWNTLPPREWWTRMGYTLRVVDRAASEMKAKEVKIISAYRSPAFNALCSHPDCEFDGKDSWHQANVAVDFTFPGISPEAVTKFCRILRYRGLFKGGVGTHGSYTHLDTRGENITLTADAVSDTDATDKSGEGAGESKGWKVVEIDGDEYVSIESIKKFYGFETLVRKEAEIILENSKVEVRFQTGSDFCVMNNVRFSLFNKIVVKDGITWVSKKDLAWVIDPVLRPNYVKGCMDFQTVLLDPMSGVRNHTGYAPHGKADEVALKVAQLVGTKLSEKGFKVVFTRDSAAVVSADERVKKINAVEEPAVAIMIGFAADVEEEQGLRTFTFDPSMPGVTKSQIEAYYAPSLCLTTAVHASVLHKLGSNTRDRGVSRIRDSSMTRIEHPVILIEGGFVTHPNEYRLINNDSYQEALAQSIVDGVSRYRFVVARKSAFPEFIPTE
jgi:N-acetylmuramoyl-L-alanine amidase